MNKDVKYLNKDFGQFRQNLINFTKNYFPTTYKDFNESSPGMLFLEMSSYVGDVLSYYTDTSFRESLLTTAKENANVLQLSQLFGYKPKLNSPSTGKLDVFQLVPAKGSGASVEPDYDYALTIDSNMQIRSDNGIVFRTTQPIDFNQDPEVTVYEINNSGEVARYLLRKQVDIISGEIVTRQFTFTNPKPYDKITLPDNNIIDIIDITDSAGNKWYQVDYLAQDTIFEDIANIPFNDPDLSQYRSTVPYILKLRSTPRRFVTRLRTDNRLEIQFGSGVSSDADEEIIPNPQNVGSGLEYLQRTVTNNLDPTNFMYTSTYGLAPSNTTLTVRYTVGGDVRENVGINTINTILNVTYLNEINSVDLTTTKDSVAITNPEPTTGGKSRDDIENIRQNAIANFAAQNRAITREDYIARVYSMPSKYGAVAKAYIIGDSQINTNDTSYPQETIPNQFALNLYLLGYDTAGNFTQCNRALKENVRTYLSNYRMLTDAINIKDAFIINIGIEFEVIPLPDYNSNEVLLRCIAELKKIMTNSMMQINGAIDINAIRTQLDRLEGVQSIPTIDFVNKVSTSQGYSGNVYDIATATKHGILYPSLDPCIFEVKYPNKDIKGKIVSP